MTVSSGTGEDNCQPGQHTRSEAAGRHEGTAMDGMVWIPGATFLMGSDRHYPEEAPAHKVTAGGFWMDSSSMSNTSVPLGAPGRGELS